MMSLLASAIFFSCDVMHLRLRFRATWRAHLLLVLTAVVGQLASGRGAWAGPPSTISAEVRGRRLVLGELWSDCPARWAAIDLGQAPPAGGRAVVSRQRLLTAISQRGPAPVAERLPASIVATSAAKVLAPPELEAWVRPAALRALPRGVALARVVVRGSTTLPAEARVARVELKRAARRAGRVIRVATVQVEHEGVVVRRLPVALHLDVSEAATRPAVRRGGTVQLWIERPLTVVGARAQSLRDLWVGDTGLFKVLSTGKVLQGRLAAPGRAEVVGAQ